MIDHLCLFTIRRISHTPIACLYHEFCHVLISFLCLFSLVRIIAEFSLQWRHKAHECFERCVLLRIFTFFYISMHFIIHEEKLMTSDWEEKYRFKVRWWWEFKYNGISSNNNIFFVDFVTQFYCFIFQVFQKFISFIRSNKNALWINLKN